MEPAARSGPSRPAPLERAEPALVRWRVRAVAVVALAASAAYLGWRALATLDASVLSLSLLALEVHAAVRLGLLTFCLWDLGAEGNGPPAEHTGDLRAAVLIPVGSEPLELLLPTVASAVALEPAHDTWVIDEGARPEVRRLALDLGARYLAVGGFNQALEVVDADVIGVLTPGYVAEAGLLTQTAGYFEDPRLAVVQGSVDSLDGLPGPSGARWRAEEAFFHRLVQPGANRWGAAQWCGPGAVLRVAALREVGGVVGAACAPELSTTIRLQRAGWRTRHHSPVLARGLATPAAGGYRHQRARRDAAALIGLWRENAFFGAGLRPTQRLAYAACLLGWFDAWWALGCLLVPLAVLLRGAVPIRADGATFALAFVLTFCLQRLAVLELARDRAPNVFSPVAALARMPSDLWAPVSVLRIARARPPAKVRRGAPACWWVLYLAQWAGGLAGGYAAASFAGLTPVHYREVWVAWAAVAWVGLNGALLMRAAGQLRQEASHVERRASVRFDLQLTGVLGDYHCDVVALSLTGAGVRLPAAVTGKVELGDEGALCFELGDSHELRVAVRSLRLRPDQTLDVGVEFTGGQQGARTRLARALFQSETPARRGPEAPGGSAASGQTIAA